jgi:hypothetical protein
MRHAAKVDDNHAEVVAALRAAGAWVWSTAPLGGGFPDLLVCFHGQLRLLEVKDGRNPPSRRRLSPDEARFALRCPVPVAVVLCAEDALTAIGAQVRVTPALVDSRGTRSTGAPLRQKRVARANPGGRNGNA